MNSRRRFLKALTGAGLVVGGCRGRSAPATSQAEPMVQVDRTPMRDAPSIPTDRVVVVRDPSAVSPDGVDRDRLRVMLDRAMAELSPAGDAVAAWQALFESTDHVALKANCLAGPMLSTHPELVTAIRTGLISANVHADGGILAYDRVRAEFDAAGYPADMLWKSGGLTGSDEYGYDEEITVFGATGTRFSKIVSEWATSIINVPVLKDHDLCGLSGALKNHFGSINNPNKLHTNHCSPHVADVNACPVIRDKHRLVVFDALNVCYNGGPGYKPESTVPYGALIVATDPVAADAVALSILEELRAEHECMPLGETDRYPEYIRVAADPEHRLGVADLDRLDIRELT